MAKWQKISKPGDFSNVAVYHNGHGVLSVSFKNLEYPEKGFFKSVLFLMLLALPFYVVVQLGGTPDTADNAHFGVMFILSIVPFIIYSWRIMHKRLFNRSIELDYPKDALRINRNDKTVKRCKLSRLVDTSVGPHPEAEVARLNRQEKGEKRPRQEEMTQCLYGWFGVGGGERALLIERVEWPDQQSLLEVQAAVRWAQKAFSKAKELAESGQAQPQPTTSGNPYQPASGDVGLNPPLD